MASSLIFATLSAVMILQCYSVADLFEQIALLKRDDASEDGTCPQTSRPLNMSLSDAWQTTRQVETLVRETFNVKKDFCLQMNPQMNNKQRGVQVMGTMATILCFAGAGSFAKEKVVLMNEMTMSISEVVTHSEVCLQEDDLKRVSCAFVDTSDQDVLYRTVLKQRFLLEGLFIGTWHD